jgi:predicted acylesterase/phospholipase RssA
MLNTYPADKISNGPRIGLALAGGGPLGIIYEIGVVLALEEALEGVNFNNLHAYVGVSAGAAVSSVLANGFTPAKMCRIFVRNESTAFPINPEDFLRPAFHLYWKGLKSLPGLGWDAFRSYLKNRRDLGLMGALSKLSLALPSGFWDNNLIDRFLSELFATRGRTNDFRKLKRHLFIVVTKLDTAEIVKFGSDGHNHVPISKAVQASTAVPGLFPPVEIEGENYVDGGLMKTVHASVALEAGTDLLFCVNPIVTFNADLVPPDERKNLHKLVEGGSPAVLAQAFRTIIHSRMQVGISTYVTDYPEKEVIVFEPNAGDMNMFFANVFSFSNRLKVCEHAYQTTRAELRARRDVLEPVLARHGIGMRMDVLKDETRHFDSHLQIPPELTRNVRLRHPVTNRLSDALDQLDEWLDSSRRTEAVADAETPDQEKANVIDFSAHVSSVKPVADKSESGRNLRR